MRRFAKSNRIHSKENIVYVQICNYWQRKLMFNVKIYITSYVTILYKLKIIRYVWKNLLVNVCNQYKYI